MIGFVIVSHSHEVAVSIRELVLQMVRERVPIAVAGGIDDAVDPIGTDAFRILAAIESVYSDDGVVVFMDLGSAILSAETALDFLPSEQRARVHLCSAPLVEGLIAAVIQATVGGTLEEVLAEAAGALAAKQVQLGPADASPAPLIAVESDATGWYLTVTVGNELGLHARPAMRIIDTISQFEAEVWITKGETTVNAASINQILTLAVEPGETIRFYATGAEAEQAIAALEALAKLNFAEADDEPLGVPSPLPLARITHPGDLVGLPASDGVAYGPVIRFAPAPLLLPEALPEDPQVALEQLQQALAAAKAALLEIQAASAQQLGENEAAIFAAQVRLLDDPDLQARAQQLILEEGYGAANAWYAVTDAAAAQLQGLADPRWQQHASDLYDVQTQVLQQLTQSDCTLFAPEQPSILVAPELAPTLLSQLSPERILAIVFERSGPASHAAILARALGIPLVVGVQGIFTQVIEGQMIAVDGYRGRVWLAPDAELLQALDEIRGVAANQQLAAEQQASLPTELRDGKRIAILANISNLAEAQVAMLYGAEGVGLLRTEYLFMNRTTLPDEAEQFQTYATIAEALAGQPLVVRTLDVGGDKKFAGWSLPTEPNPALGWRGLRYWLGYPEMARTQLRALLRVSAHYPLQLMLPMLSTMDELYQARALLEAAKQELQAAGHAYAETIALGVMIETPAAVFLASQLANHVDFFSIGTNDLTQYIMAADRNNPQVAGLTQAFQPALLRAIEQVVQAAHQVGIPVSVCGELASDPQAAVLLVGLGVDTLSMAPRAIPRVKATLRAVNLPQVISLAEATLELDSASAVERYLWEHAPF
jgi:phosphoenolpyruvate-protein phosphotransferase/dihydroxyacetone kinase phosphotransfer subunit